MEIGMTIPASNRSQAVRARSLPAGSVKVLWTIDGGGHGMTVLPSQRDGKTSPSQKRKGE